MQTSSGGRPKFFESIKIEQNDVYRIGIYCLNRIQLQIITNTINILDWNSFKILANLVKQ